MARFENLKTENGGQVMTARLTLFLTLLLVSCVDPHSTMLSSSPNTPYAKTAVAFAEALVEKRFSEAHSMLTTHLQQELSPDELEVYYKDMTEYSNAPATVEGPFTSMESWPDRLPDDIGWVYVSIDSNDFMEGIAVIVTREGSELKIREVEWGRP